MLFVLVLGLCKTFVPFYLILYHIWLYFKVLFYSTFKHFCLFQVYFSSACPTGFFGWKCKLSCANCAEDACDSDKAECLKGCKPGFYGKHCLLGEFLHLQVIVSPRNLCSKMQCNVKGRPITFQTNYLWRRKVCCWMLGFRIRRFQVRVLVVSALYMHFLTPLMC